MKKYDENVVEKVLLTFEKIQDILNYRAAGELAVP